MDQGEKLNHGPRKGDCQRGERSELAFTVLLERHARMVLGACRRVLGDRHKVQDAFQATFLVLVRNTRSIRNRESVAGRLQSVAYRVACSARSAANRRQFHERRYAEQSERGLTSEIHGTVTYDAGRHHYTYSTGTGKWDHLDLSTITDTQEEEGMMKPGR
jgi:DNA-directed RNA polymerase specialized sigma24 family protein